MNSLSNSRLVKTCQLVSKRFSGGGGGRPGGKPTFSWKEKKLLGLDKKVEKVKVINPPLFSISHDNEKTFQDYDGFKFIPVEKFSEINKEISALEAQSSNESNAVDSYKKVKVASLFGSNKTAGALPRKGDVYYSKNFSHKRIFGDKQKN